MLYHVIYICNWFRTISLCKNRQTSLNLHKHNISTNENIKIQTLFFFYLRNYYITEIKRSFYKNGVSATDAQIYNLFETFSLLILEKYFLFFTTHFEINFYCYIFRFLHFHTLKKYFFFNQLKYSTTTNENIKKDIPRGTLFQRGIIFLYNSQKLLHF